MPYSKFDLSESLVPEGEIHHGGPPKDGIPAISNPKFFKPSKAKYLQPQDRVIGFTDGEQFRAYPLRILNYHEVVNDEIGNVPIAVTYCPLCDSAVIFERRTPIGEREFGVSGMLYDSNVLMYDRGGDPESLWSQVMTKGISGAGVGQSLQTLPLELTTWEEWKRRNPDTLILSDRTRNLRDYRISPYAEYFNTDQLYFPVNHRDERLPMNVRVLGVWTDGAAKAYPLSSFSRERNRIEDTIEGRSLTIEFIPEAKSLRVSRADEGVHWMYSLWFAWVAFHPETEIGQTPIGP